MEAKRDEFRSYLETSGAVSALTNVLIKLFDLKEKPEDSVQFIRKNIGDTGEIDSEIENLKRQLEDANARITQLEGEVNRRKSGSVYLGDANITDIASSLEEIQQDEQCNSMLKKYLTKEILDELVNEKTPTFQSTLLDCIQSGLKVHDTHIGVYASDPECYTTFAKLFEPIIRDYHKGLEDDFEHPPLEWGDPTTLSNPDPDGLYIVCSQIRCSRTLENFPFHTKMTEEHYINVMNTIRDVLENTGDEQLNGNFHALDSITDETITSLSDEKFLFDHGDASLQAAGSSRHWPIGRAIFINHDKSFVSRINYRNHLQLIFVQCGGDLIIPYQRLIACAKIIDERLQCVRHSKYGWLTFSPAVLGNALEICVNIKLTKLAKQLDKLTEVLEKYNLKIAQEKPDDDSVTYEIRNARCLGLTEFDAVTEVFNGITALIDAEKEL